MIDVDRRIDDAAALASTIGLCANPVAVSTVTGNVPIDLSTENTLHVLSLLGKPKVPVFRGAIRPLVATSQDASHSHGGNGLRDARLPASRQSEAVISGPEAIIAQAEQHEGESVVVMVGPLTNLAIALSLRHRITRQIAKVVIMGRAYFNPGNISMDSEFNIYGDPDAANQVFSAS